MSTDPTLKSGSKVVIAAFDDIPEHLFLVSEVHEDCVCGTALTGPLKGSYGEPNRDLSCTSYLAG